MVRGELGYRSVDVLRILAVETVETPIAVFERRLGRSEGYVRSLRRRRWLSVRVVEELFRAADCLHRMWELERVKRTRMRRSSVDTRDLRDPELLGQEYTRRRIRGIPADVACEAVVSRVPSIGRDHAGEYIRELEERDDRFAASMLAWYREHGSFNGAPEDPGGG
jgi:hypothetical protein